MKTSNIIFVATGLLIFGSIFWYDLLLKANYDTGKYKQPYGDYASLGFTGFDRVRVPGSTASNVKFVQGPFSVKIDEYGKAYTRFHQEGSELVIQSAFEHNYINNPVDYVIIISCPVLREITAGATYLTSGTPFTDSVVRPDWVMRSLLIEGFQQDSLVVSQDYGSTVVLSGNKLRHFSAGIGQSAASGSRLVILDNNRLDTALIDVRTKSQFFLENSSINTFSYRLADDASINVTGNAQHLLTAAKPWNK